jgi:hypothetical protein
MRNDEQLLNLRPDLGLNNTAAAGDEKFQNETLRPILKWQHALLCDIFKQYIVKRKDVYHAMPKLKQSGWIAESVRADLRLRNMLAGTVIGYFTATELRYFLDHEPDCMRRLTTLLIQRLQSEDYSV